MTKRIILSLVATTSLIAGETSLEPIIISATQTQTTPWDAPTNASIVSQETLAHLPITHLKEAIKGLEGVTSIAHRGASDVNPTVVLRGIPDQSRTMILLDGIPMNTSYTSSASTPYTILPEELEQIEVIRGPFSSLYGSSAMGGVINYVTQMPNKPQYKGSIGYGNAFTHGEAQSNLTKLYASAADKLRDNLTFKISYGSLGSEGYKSDYVAIATKPPVSISGYQTQISPSTLPQYIVGNAGMRGTFKYDLSTKFVYTPTSSDTLSGSFRKSHYDMHYINPESFLTNALGSSVYSYSVRGNRLSESNFLQGASALESNLYALEYQHHFTNSTFAMRYSLLSLNDWYTSAGTTATRNGGSGTLTPREAHNEMLHTTWQTVMGNSLLLLGGEYKRNTSVSDTTTLMDWRDENSKTLTTASSGGKERIFASFVDVKSDLTEALSSTVGGRFESWEGYDGYSVDTSNSTLTKIYASQKKNNFSPKLSLNYRLSDTTILKTSWGQAFRAPDPINLYRTYEIAALNRVYVANPNLTPEHSESYDFGVEHKTLNQGLLKAYGFHTIIDDMISTGSPIVVGGKSYYERVNVGKARSQGYELAYIQPLFDDFTFNTNYTKTYTKILENRIDPTVIGKRFAGIPETMINGSLIYDNHQWYAVFNGNYQSKIYNNTDNSDTVSNVYGSMDGVAIFNTKIGYNVSKTMEITFTVNNLRNTLYYSYERGEGRSWFTQINLKI